MIIGGESFVSSSPAFSNDAKNLLVCTGNTVSIFSISTGMKIMELEGHKAPVTSVIVVPTATLGCKILCNCWTSSLDGTICYWDFSLPELIKKVDVNLPIFSMVIPHFSSLPLETNEKLRIPCAFVSVEDVKVSVEDIKAPSDKPKASHGQIRMVDLNKSRLVGGPLQETRKPVCLRASMSGGFFGTQKNHKLHIWKVPAQKCKPVDVKKLVVHHTKKLTTLAFHPTERIVAGGDITGRILVWRGFGKRKFSKQENERKLQNDDEGFGVCGDDDADSCSTWHWHPNEVKFLSFSSDGAYLYSGGKEGVLVIWQLDTGKNKFLPRIGSPLLYFTDSLDPTISAISCADNQIHLLRMPSMEILKSITGIKPPSTLPEICEGMSSGFVFNHASGLVGLPTENYCVQFYSLYNKREVSQVQVCERNYQPLDEVTVVLTQVTLSKDGSLMGTVEVKLPEEGIGGLVSLKFWSYGSCSRVYSLSTVIYEPHSEAGISDLAFHPSRSMAVSSSFGGDFKIWVHSHIYQQKDQNPGWRCQSVGSYKKHPMTAAVFSPDGSVLAVAAETVVTLWNPDTNVLVAVIGETLMPIVTLSFVGKSEHLVSLSRGSNPQLSVWNMSALSISWSYKLLAEAVACSSNSSHFAVLALAPEAYKQFETVEVALESGDGVILFFDAENPIPNFTWFAKKAKGGGLAFLEANPSPHDETDAEGKAPAEMLVYINGDHEYVIFDPHSREDENQTSTIPRKNRVSLDEETEQFGYASIYGELPEFKTKRDQIASIPFVPSDKPWEAIFSGSSHALPPLSKLCLAFLSSLLEKRTTVQQ